MKKQNLRGVFMNGILTENPTLRMLLGMCPTLAVSTAASRGLGMGLATTFVLMGSNIVVSSLRNLVPEKVRIPAFVVIIATFATMVDLLMKAFLPSLSDSLGIYIPLIVVNCIIFARAESFAFKNPVFPSLIDGAGMGLGFTLSIVILSALREIIGSGTLFDARIMPVNYMPMAIVVRPSGGFVMLGLLIIMVNGAIHLIEKRKINKEREDIQ